MMMVTRRAAARRLLDQGGVLSMGDPLSSWVLLVLLSGMSVSRRSSHQPHHLLQMEPEGEYGYTRTNEVATINWRRMDWSLHPGNEPCDRVDSNHPGLWIRMTCPNCDVRIIQGLHQQSEKPRRIALDLAFGSCGSGRGQVRG